jgi:Kef-type K+ transport system membrane component KefB
MENIFRWLGKLHYLLFLPIFAAAAGVVIGLILLLAMMIVWCGPKIMLGVFIAMLGRGIHQLIRDI